MIDSLFFSISLFYIIYILTFDGTRGKIMKNFRIPPFDQHLTCNGKDLNDNQASLAALGIYPGTVIILQVRMFL